MQVQRHSILQALFGNLAGALCFACQQQRAGVVAQSAGQAMLVAAPAQDCYSFCVQWQPGGIIAKRNTGIGQIADQPVTIRVIGRQPVEAHQQTFEGLARQGVMAL